MAQRITWLLLLAVGILTAQVNTEALRGDKLKDGLSGSFSASMNLHQGNTQILQTKVDARLDYFAQSKHLFTVANLHRGREADKPSINKGFIHLRGVQQLAAKLAIEGFTQIEFNEFIRLKNRILFGLGTRIWLLNKNELRLALGVGGMAEYERLYASSTIAGAEESLETNLIRSTNYLDLKWVINDHVILGGTTYLQPNIADFGNYRILWSSTLEVAFSTNLSLKIEAVIRYDSEPPMNVDSKYDLELTNGITYHF